MGQLIVRNLDDELVRRLKERAAANGRSAEEEHRQILRQSLTTNDDFVAALLSIPSVGEDADFERLDSLPRNIEL